MDFAEEIRIDTATLRAIFALADAFGFRPQGEPWSRAMAVVREREGQILDLDWWNAGFHLVGELTGEEARRLSAALARAETGFPPDPSMATTQSQNAAISRFTAADLAAMVQVRRMAEIGGFRWQRVGSGLLMLTPDRNAAHHAQDITAQ